MTIKVTIAERIAGWRAVAPAGHVTLLVMDALGCVLAAAREGAASAAVTVAGGLGGPPEATLLPGPRRLPAPAAAFAGGVLVHALDFDDTHAGGLVHPSAPVVPVAFAVGEEVGAGGAEVVAAAGAGIELVCRLGLAAPHGFHARGLHATSVCGVFGAALAAARLYGLDDTATAHALGIAGSQAGGLLEFLRTGGTAKQLHPGFAAQAGVLAARLARAGCTGPAAVFEGEYGVYRALLGVAPDEDAILGDLGMRWELANVGVKPYPACRLLHAALDAAAVLHPRLPDPAGIERIVVELHPDSVPIVCGPLPSTPYQARFSLGWSVAATLLDGVPDYRRIGRPDVLELAARVEHVAVASAGPAADQPARVTLYGGGGELDTADVPRASGAPGSPGLAALVEAKAGLGPATALVRDLPAAPSLRPLLTVLEQL